MGVDVTFEREGRAMGSWLQDLVSQDAAMRDRAGGVLMAMYYRVATSVDEIGVGSTAREMERHCDQWRVELRRAIERSEFPAEEFFLSGAAMIVAAQAEWEARCRHRSALSRADEAVFDRIMSKLNAQLAADGSETNKAAVAKRAARALCASLARDCERDETEDVSSHPAMQQSTMVLNWAIEHAGPRLLEAPEAISILLGGSNTRWVIDEALRNIGPAASEWAGEYLRALDEVRGPYFGHARELASIGRGVSAVIDALAVRLEGMSEYVVRGAAQTLELIAPDLAGRQERVMAALDRKMAEREGLDAIAFLPAWASVGRERADVRARTLAIAGPRPARMVKQHGYEVDEVMYERGTALSSLKYFVGNAKEAVPALAEALDSFEEFDPDWCYGGEHQRVCDAMMAFGKGAAPAVPALVTCLERWQSTSEEGREWPGHVIAVLANIGPEAREALPVLLEIRAKSAIDGEPEPDDPLGRAVRSIRGEGTE